MASKSDKAKKALDYYHANKEKISVQIRERKYGLNKGEYNKRRQMQDGDCCICGDGDGSYVDHCHDTNEVRDLLCMKCNAGLGMFNDDVDTVRAALNYLEEHEQRIERNSSKKVA